MAYEYRPVPAVSGVTGGDENAMASSTVATNSLNANFNMSCSGITRLGAGDPTNTFVEAYGFQDSGAGLVVGDVHMAMTQVANF